MDGIRIAGTGKCLPKEIVTNEMLSEIVDTTDEWIESRTGMKKRYFCGEEDNLYLASNAAREAVERAEVSAGEIGIVIVATFTSDYFMPSTACLIQKELGLDEDVLCFDLNAACSGFVYGIETARALLGTTEKKYALVIGSEVISKKLDMQDRSTCILFGDGAGAAVIEKAENKKYAGIFGCRGNAEDLYCRAAEENSRKIHMNGQEIYKFAVRTMPQLICDAAKKAGLELSDIDLFVCHQANLRIIESIAKTLGQPLDKFFIQVGEYANTSAASIAIALCDLESAGRLEPGMKIILTGFGAGLTWGAIGMEW